MTCPPITKDNNQIPTVCRYVDPMQDNDEHAPRTTSVPASIDRMFAAWNEPDPVKVRAHLDAALADDVRFVDPTIDLVGIDAFEANVHDVHGQIPGAVYERSQQVQHHHGHYRYPWTIHRDGEVLLTGADVTVVDDAGRVATVIGFFDDPEATGA